MTPPHAMLPDGQPSAPELRRLLLPLALALVVALAGVMPLAWYAVRIDGVRARAATAALQLADLVRRDVDERPRLWRYDTWKLLAHLGPPGSGGELRRVVVVAPDGLRVDVGLPQPAPDADLAWAHAPLRAGTGHALWVGASLAGANAEALRLTGLATALALVLATLLYGVPVQAAQRADARRARAVRATGLQEHERRAIARDLHDATGQTLTGLRLHLQMVRQRAADARGQADADTALGMIDGALDDIRRAVRSLAPPGLAEVGLHTALQRLGDDFGERSGLDVTLELEPPRPLAAGVETAAYRIAQEALTNVARHAAARRVRVSLATGDGNLTLEVHDDGCGIGPATAGSGGAGLAGMRERADLLGGHCTWEDVPGGGTRVRAVLPLAWEDR